MKTFWKKWLKGDDASVAIEAGMLFPVMASLMLGTIDIGVALNVNQKVINSCNALADVLARYQDINNTAFADAIVGSKLMFLPYGTESMAYDVQGLKYTSAIASTPPVMQWHNTCAMNMNTTAASGATGLGVQNEGVIAVTIKYVYTPYFSGFLAGNINMQEVSYARGRKGGFVSRTGSLTPC